jgi:exosome complex RNA-binding protein Rrp42 (RNase PH superfamily)
LNEVEEPLGRADGRVRDIHIDVSLLEKTNQLLDMSENAVAARLKNLENLGAAN